MQYCDGLLSRDRDNPKFGDLLPNKIFRVGAITEVGCVLTCDLRTFRIVMFAL